jgi:hypothetical protein
MMRCVPSTIVSTAIYDLLLREATHVTIEGSFLGISCPLRV